MHLILLRKYIKTRLLTITDVKELEDDNQSNKKIY